jgi:hypothetical protein
VNRAQNSKLRQVGGCLALRFACPCRCGHVCVKCVVQGPQWHQYLLVSPRTLTVNSAAGKDTISSTATHVLWVVKPNKMPQATAKGRWDSAKGLCVVPSLAHPWPATQTRAVSVQQRVSGAAGMRATANAVFFSPQPAPTTEGNALGGQCKRH